MKGSLGGHRFERLPRSRWRGANVARRRWAAIALAVAAALFALLERGVHDAALPTAAGAAAHERAESSGVRPLRAAPGARGVRTSPPPLAAAVDGIVRGARGATLSGASICVLASGAARTHNPGCTTSDALGRFTLEPVFAGAVLLAAAPGHLPTAHTLDAEAARERRTLTITLQPGGAVVRGMVVDATGGPIIGAVVTARSSAATVTALALSDSQGRFELSVDAGEVDLEAHAEAYAPAWLRARAPASGLLLPMGAASSIAGDVVDMSSEEPLAGVKVYATSEHGVAFDAEATTGPSGEFRIHGLRGGVYEVVASSPAWRSGKELVSVEVGQAVEDVQLRAEPATSLGGLITRDGELCPSGEAEAASATARYGGRSQRGHVQLEGVLPGTYTVTVRCEHALPHVEELDVGTDPVERSWSLTAGLHVRGHVVDAAEQPAQAWVHVTPVGNSEPRPNALCHTDASGAFACGGLAPGAHTLSLANDEGTTLGEERPIMLVDRDAEHLVLQTDASASLRVRTTADPAPAKVFARDEQLASFEARLDGDGYRVEHLRPGRYHVYVALGPSSTEPGVEAIIQRPGDVEELSLAVPPLLELAGYVVDERGEPSPHAWVTVRSSAGFPATSGTEPSVLSDDRGAFEFPRLPPGSYDLEARSGSRDGTLRAVRAGTVGFALRVSERTSLMGAVRSASGTPVSPFTVSYRLEGGRTYELSGVDGQFELSNIEPGTYWLNAESAEGAAAAQVSLTSGRGSEVVLTVQP